MSNLDASAYDEFYKSLLSDFLGEAEQLLVSLNDNLLRLDEWMRSPAEQREQYVASNVLGELFRAAHSFKGLSNMLGLEEIEQLIQHVEKTLDAARKEQLPITGDFVRLLFESIDGLGNLIDAMKDPDAPAVCWEPLVERMARLLASSGVEPKPGLGADAERTLDRIETHVARALREMAPTPEAMQAQDVPKPVVVVTRPGPKSSAAAPSVGDEVRTEAETAALFDELTNDADMTSRFIPIFIDETEIALDQLTESLLALEGGGSRDDLKRLLVISHRIKGSAASVGLKRAAKLAHLMEDLLQGPVNSGENLPVLVTDAMLKCVDEFRIYVGNLKQGDIPEDRFPQLAVELLQAGRRATTTDSTAGAARGKTASAERQEPSSSLRACLRRDVAIKDAGPAATKAKSGTAAASRPIAKNAEETPPTPVSAMLRERVIAAAPAGLPLFAGVATFQPNLALVGLKAELLYEKLSNLGDVCYFDPPLEQLDMVERLECIRFGLATERSEQQIRVALKTAGVIGAVVEALFARPIQDIPCVVEEQTKEEAAAVQDEAGTSEETSARKESSDQGAAPVPSPAESSVPAGERRNVGRLAETASKPTETLRVDVDRLDQLMNLAGQLVVSKARFTQISDSLRSIVSDKRAVLALGNVLQSLAVIAEMDMKSGQGEVFETELRAVCEQARRIHGQLEPVRHEVQSFYQMRASINELDEAVHQLDRVADEIQKNVMDTRMVPIGPLFARFHRVVRDITRAGGKSIRLVIRGENTELDKRMIDELGDPLIHMVRNSADHGIEPADARVRAGKPAEGTITLDAFHRGNSILIQISDDGQGLDPERLMAKAIEKGFVSARDAEQMTPQQVYSLIWQPGFSTAGRITEVSGRGVGMDIVKSRVESLNGAVDLENSPGQGLTVTIKLPLTLAILPSLMVEVGGDTFAMPMESVGEIVKVGRDEIATVHGKKTAQVRGRVISIVDLDEIFQWRCKPLRATDRSTGPLTLVIVYEGDREIGLAIDRVIGEEDVVIKSMAENFINVSGIAGASVLGSGRVSLILDLAAVIDMAAQPASVISVS